MNKYNFINKELLIKEYSKNKKSSVQIAKNIGCNFNTIRRKLIKYNIKIRSLDGNYIDGRTLKKYFCIDCNKLISYEHLRCQSCANKGRKLSKLTKQKMSLEHGGTGIPYEFNDYPSEYFKIRPKILKRDNYTCQLCFEYGNEVHHIDYDKENCDENNLLCLCHQCNTEANFNRDYWYAYFKYIIEEMEYEMFIL